MKSLYLIRHAKSSWDSPMIDFDRPLSLRGINDAHLVSNKLFNLLPNSFIVWSSNAKRAKETAVIMAENFRIPLDTIIFKRDLYTFDEQELQNQVKNCENKYDNLILFGHNDAITNFVNKFGNLFLENVPTSGVVHLEFDIDSWKDLKKGITKNTVFPSHIKHEQQFKSQSLH